MKGFVRILSVATLAIGSATAVEAQALPSAADVVAKYVAAIGGRDAILKITSMNQQAVMEIPAAGLTADVEVAAAAPNLIVTRSTIPGVGEMVQGFNGTVGWDINPMQGPRLLTEKEIVQAREMNDFHGSRLFPADQFSTMEVVEKLEYNGEQAYKVKMVRKSGNESIQYFSVASGLLIGAEVTQESQMGAMTVQMKFSEFQQQDGLRFPTKTEVTIGPNSIVTTVKSTTFNTVPPNTFEVPAAIKPLINK